MQYSLVREIFGKPWQISALGIQQNQPALMSILHGAEFTVEEEPQENLPYLLSASTFEPRAWMDDDEEDQPEEEQQKEKVINVLPVRGVLTKHDMTCGPRGARTLGNRLRRADTDESVIGHILIIEGPGGSAMAVPELSDAISECKKPVVVWVDGLMASAHMYVASYADNIIASRENDLVGCIGTLIVYNGRISQSEEDLFKIREVTIYADEAYEKNEEYETAINKFDFKLTKEHILNPHNKQFTDDIKKNLPGVEDKHLHGRTFPAKDVVGALVHSIGSFDTAIEKVLELAKFKKEQNQNNAQNSVKTGAAANNNSPKKTEMKQYKHVNAALGVDQLEAVDGVVSLNDEQLQAIDSKLGEDPDAEIKGQLEAANSTIGKHETTIQTQKEKIEELEGELETANSTIETQKDEIDELKGEAAEETVKVNKSGKKTDGSQAITEKYDNPLDGIEEISQEFLGKSLND